MNFIKKIIPESLLKLLRPIYHGAVALVANIYFGNPSSKLVVIAVTGTNGKSTTANLTAAILNEAGKKCGFSSTVTWDTGAGVVLNKSKITMPSGWLLHKRMAEMLKNGCKYAVLEVSSEGLAQNRHLGINFDVAVFTNLTPEHIEAHGSFENYRKAKGKLFQSLKKFQISNFKFQINPKLQKTIITNSDDEHSEYYRSFKADKYISYGVKQRADYQADNINYSADGIKFILHTTYYMLHLKGQFDVYNSLAAIAAAASQNVSLDICKAALERFGWFPGGWKLYKTSLLLLWWIMLTNPKK
jgi:UDP-N-acetylmuramoyl-L-alanyl-D-glutamate--2,6-diaminopimelate ligase